MIATLNGKLIIKELGYVVVECGGVGFKCFVTQKTSASIGKIGDTVLVRPGQKIPVDGVFVAVGQMPRNEKFANIVTLDDYGYIASGEDCRTGTDGVFAAGDCRTKAYRQVATAVADGASAALNACRYLDQ